MNDMSMPAEAVEQLPKARVTAARRRYFAAVWIVPLIACAVAAYVAYDRLREFGPTITIRFKDGGGLRTGITPIKYRGVPIGEVTGVQLSEDRQQVLVRARLYHTAASIAQQGAVFWIVRPEVGIGNVTGLSTVITGPEIQVLPGTGERKDDFVGLERAPAELDRSGLRIVLRTGRAGALQRDSPVYYRGVEVGVVQELDLAPDSAAVDIHVLIRQRYTPLVRSGSMFWNVSGASMNAGLFSGVQFKMESLKALATGGIAFATPSDAAAGRVKPGTVFPLYSEPNKEWLEWTPRIPLAPDSDIGSEPQPVAKR